MRYFGQGAAAQPDSAAWAPNWNIPSSGSTVDVNGSQVPYYLAPAGTTPGDDVLVDGVPVPYYLARPDARPFSVPGWAWPVAAGALAVGALIYIAARRKKRRR
jgi:FtsP/CotA-like multicopper oxidase with cupredoxin domain